jgi:hypothetical protein
LVDQGLLGANRLLLKQFGDERVALVLSHRIIMHLMNTYVNGAAWASFKNSARE